MITVCCVCHRVKHQKEWVDEPVPEGEIPSHGYCPACADLAYIELLLLQLKSLDTISRRFPRIASDGAAA